MLNRRQAILSGSAAALLAGSRPATAAESGPFTADWQSLYSGYRHPEWFRDAKLGIWAHWGPQCQPGFGDWYGRLMYIQGRFPWIQGKTAYEHHVETYGHPSQVGFIDLIGQWKAENWDPDYLVRKYAAAGARYFVGMGCHHDNL